MDVHANPNHLVKIQLVKIFGSDIKLQKLDKLNISAFILKRDKLEKRLLLAASRFFSRHEFR